MTYKSLTSNEKNRKNQKKNRKNQKKINIGPMF